MNICVIGTGYVGLVSGTGLSEMGDNVICVDKDKAKIDSLKAGKIPIYEPGLQEMVDRNTKTGRLHFTTDLPESVKKSQIIFIAVGTPPFEDGSADLSHVITVANEIAQCINEYKVIVVKSTVPVGTCDKVEATIKANTKLEFDVVSNPEFLKEGDAINDFMKPDRIVVGTSSLRAAELMHKLYMPFARSREKLIIMDRKSSEMTKYAANAMLATKISFINEIANICERLGANVEQVRKGIGSDPRIGYHFIFPGVGFGGSCLPKDINALIKMAEDGKYDAQIIKAIKEINTQQRMLMFDRIRKHFKGQLLGKQIAIWGLAFKPNTDDMREAPAITVINELLQEKVEIHASDPAATDEAKKIFGDKIRYFANPMDAVKDADALVLMTEWGAFRNPDFTAVKAAMKGNVIFDGRNIYQRKELEGLGFVYYGIGN